MSTNKMTIDKLAINRQNRQKGNFEKFLKRFIKLTKVKKTNLPNEREDLAQTNLFLTTVLKI